MKLLINKIIIKPYKKCIVFRFIIFEELQPVLRTLPILIACYGLYIHNVFIFLFFIILINYFIYILKLKIIKKS